MTRAEVRRRLALEWWRWLGFALGPLFLLNLLFGGSQALGSVMEMPLFIAGMASMFVSLPLFSGYKRALIATQAALDGEHEREAWLELARQRRKGFLGAGLPAWIAALALFSGLNAVALILLAMSSVVLLCLYRIPRQLG
ncbi:MULTISPECIES: MFS transporter [unclassified Pseudomonas]|uniref:MFS transporter n=1 Tax=unclassified Pseudomonas TaxID=196821 RepID=UPI00244A418E|nr:MULTISPECIES: MFS transporter [unclassified Pseudomonas]MDG9926730.1 MFS transporter [Pseudomonas sp. GD04042]MDH0482201.1 MFS transporter [Pseudomonas sp. GD04015]MDH0603636.1 MFS transporter [Pseudomonas sp. GD03869]